MTDLAEERRLLDQKERTQRQFLAATGRPSPFAERVRGALFAVIGPRLALDAQMPDLDPAVAGIDRGNFHHHRKAVADSVRRSLKGRLGRDADIEDIEALLEALERDDDGEAQDRGRRRARDEVDRPGYSQPEPPEDDPWPEAFDFLDEELESMRSELGEDNYRRLRAASDRRRRTARDPGRARDEESPYKNFDRRRTARDDPPDFPGMPRPGGSMVPNPSSVDRPGFGAPRDIGAKDRRRFGQDSRPTGFASRFAFTQRAVTEGQSRIPGRAGGNP